MKLLTVLCGLIAVAMVASLPVNSGFAQSDGTKQDHFEEIKHSENPTGERIYVTDNYGNVRYLDPVINNGTDDGPGSAFVPGMVMASMTG